MARAARLAAITAVFFCAACSVSVIKWQPLLGDNPAAHWRGYRLDSLPSGWQLVDGALTRVGPGGDIITRETYDDFELTLDDPWPGFHTR